METAAGPVADYPASARKLRSGGGPISATRGCVRSGGMCVRRRPIVPTLGRRRTHIRATIPPLGRRPTRTRPRWARRPDYTPRIFLERRSDEEGEVARIDVLQVRLPRELEVEKEIRHVEVDSESEVPERRLETGDRSRLSLNGTDIALVPRGARVEEQLAADVPQTPPARESDDQRVDQRKPVLDRCDRHPRPVEREIIVSAERGRPSDEERSRVLPFARRERQDAARESFDRTRALYLRRSRYTVDLETPVSSNPTAFDTLSIQRPPATGPNMS